MGWGYLVEVDDEVVHLGYGGAPTGTNNTAELTAAIEGIKAALPWIEKYSSSPILLVSDSQYTLGMACGRYSPSKNLELVAELRSLCEEHLIGVQWVPGHTGVAQNEIADNLAGLGKAEEVERGKNAATSTKANHSF